jgi:hypothetical protein
MRIPEDFFRAVCFLGVEYPSGQRRYGGTAFLVSVPLEGSAEWVTTYIVTARHNIVKASANATQVGGAVCLRFNDRNPDNTVTLELGDAKWITPDDPHTDVAILNWTPPARVDHRTIPRRMLATAEIIRRERIGLGDELTMVGLFSRVPGEGRNQPIVRAGIISAEPSEPLINELTGGPMHGCYLAELRSIGGLSGSPVFVFLPEGRTVWEPSPSVRESLTFYLFGLVHGHWNLDESMYIATDHGRKEEPLNTGIGVIVPISDALALIDSPEQLALRRELVMERRVNQAPTPDWSSSAAISSQVQT